MNAMATIVESVVTGEQQAYRNGYADGYLAGKRDATARKPKAVAADKRLSQDLARAQYAIGVLERATPDSFTAVSDEIFDEGRLSELRRMNRAVNDPQLLWSIYRRNDKGKPYFDAEANPCK